LALLLLYPSSFRNSLPELIVFLYKGLLALTYSPVFLSRDIADRVAISLRNISQGYCYSIGSVIFGRLADVLQQYHILITLFSFP
jgi:hypothetical protein